MNFLSTFFYYNCCIWHNNYSLYVFWKASQEVEEKKAKGFVRDGKPRIGWPNIQVMRKDNNFGMVISEFTTWCILLVGATVLHNSGVTDMKNAADAAKTLESLVHSFPNSGYFR